MKKFDYDKIYKFDNLYNAYIASRKGKRSTREVIQFEMNAGANLCKIQEKLMNGTYKLAGYYHFTIHDPKLREIYALHYQDRIVQHSLCDNVLAPFFESHLIYDNSACRKGKGTLFAMNRLNAFMHEHYRQYGKEGYFLKCDIRKFFDSIDHTLLKQRLEHIVDDERTMRMLCNIIDSYEVTPGRGIPMGNQTSQWFALYYLDPLDRLIKEKLRIKHYTRYMDDCILISNSKETLNSALSEMRNLLNLLHLEFNAKTQIFPISHGVEYLGWRFYLTDSGAVVRRLKKHSKIRWQHRLRKLQNDFDNGNIDLPKVNESVVSYQNHMSYGNTYNLYCRVMEKFNFDKANIGD
jgi:RNA-directed DNA polymerase